MAKRFILFEHGRRDGPIEAIASDCAAVNALNGRFSSDEEMWDELATYGVASLTDHQVSMVRSAWDRLTSAVEADLENARLLSEDELIERVVRTRDRLPATPLFVKDGRIISGSLDRLVEDN